MPRYWKIGLLALLASSGGLLIGVEHNQPPTPAADKASSPSAPAAAASTLSVPQRAGLSAYRPVAPEAPAKQLAPPPVASVEPPMPAVPYRFAGTLGQQVFLAKDTAIVAVAAGDTLDDVYRVDAIDDKGVALTYLPLGRTVVIDFQPGAARPR
jgi:hypothetical protein